MILVSVGNATQAFPRLLQAVDEQAGQGLFAGEEIVVQAGHTPFTPRHCTVVDFLAMDEFVAAVQHASLLICHGGAGILHHAFACAKVPVVMPRRVIYGEHRDDQFELVSTLAAAGRVVPAYEPDDLRPAVERAKALAGADSPQAINPPGMVGMIAAALEELLGSPPP